MTTYPTCDNDCTTTQLQHRAIMALAEAIVGEAEDIILDLSDHGYAGRHTAENIQRNVSKLIDAIRETE